MLIDPNAERQNPRPGSGAIRHGLQTIWVYVRGSLPQITVLPIMVFSLAGIPHGLQTAWVYVRGSLPQTTVLPIMVFSSLGGVIAARTIRVRRIAESSGCRRSRSAAAF